MTCKNIIDISSLNYLKVKASNVQNAWNITLPLFPLGFNNAEQERRLILENLSSVFPYRMILMPGEEKDWRFLAPDESLLLLGNELDEGGWILLFFKHDSKVSFDDIRLSAYRIPNDIIAKQLLYDIDAAAAIWSWFDDVEWFVAINEIYCT
jgi:hypothetical protein